MARHPISVTLEADNLTWLKGRAGAAGESVSELLDQLVTAARHAGAVAGTRSVAGTIDIDAADPGLERADEAVRAVYQNSIRRPLLVRDEPAPYAARSKKSRPGKKPRG